MKADKIGYQNTNFKSRFINNKILEQSFDRAAMENDRNFLQSIKAILNDGKDDVFELRQRTQKHMTLYKNGMIEDEGHIFLSYYGNVGTQLLKKYAGKILGKDLIGGKYNGLTAEEKRLVQKEVDIIKDSAEKFEDGYFDFIDTVQSKINHIKKALEENARREIKELKEIVCK